MKQHKWHKEIKAWADGAKIQIKSKSDGTWVDCIDGLLTFSKDFEYRIKPQPKEPQYYCVWVNHKGIVRFNEPNKLCETPQEYKYIGKIKLEERDE